MSENGYIGILALILMAASLAAIFFLRRKNDAISRNLQESDPEKWQSTKKTVATFQSISKIISGAVIIIICLVNYPKIIAAGTEPIAVIAGVFGVGLILWGVWNYLRSAKGAQ